MPTAHQTSDTYRISGENTAPPIPLPNGLRIAADRPEVKNFSYLADAITGLNTKVPRVLANGTGRYLMLTFDNWGVGWDTTGAHGPSASQWDNANLNPVTFEATLSEMDGSTFYRVYFSHVAHADGTIETLTPWTATTVTVEGGGTVFAAVDLGSSRPPGTQLLEHCYISCTSGGHIWRHKADLAGGAGETVTFGAGEPSKVTSLFTGVKPAIAGGDGSGAWSSSIRHIDAPPAQIMRPTVINGDSLTAGTYGWRQALAALHVPHIHLGRGTESAQTFLLNDNKTVYRRRLAALGGFDRGVVQYGTNDLALNNPTQTLSLLQSRIRALVTLQKGWGAAEVLVGTLPANTKSTDGFTTLANQILDMSTSGRGKNEQVLLDLNAWMRQGSTFGSVTPQAWHNTGEGFYTADIGGATTIMDSSPTDTPSTIAKWTVVGGPHTADGLHPGTTLGKNDAAAAVPREHFTQNIGGLA